MPRAPSDAQFSPPAHFAHTLLRARDWQDRPEFAGLCDWWRSSSNAELGMRNAESIKAVPRSALDAPRLTGVCALVGIGGAGKTAIAERCLRVLPGSLPALPDTPKDETLLPPSDLFVFSFYDAPNPDSFFTELAAWLNDFCEPRSSRREEAHSSHSGSQSLLTSSATAEARRSLDEGLRIARDCGYGIHHNDLLLERARLHILCGEPLASLDDLRVALDDGHKPPPDSGFPVLLAATDPECGYAWGIAEGRHLRAQAFLLQAAQTLGRPDFAPANFKALPAEVRSLIEFARKELELCRELRRRIQDPKVRDTEQVLNELDGGILTQFPISSLLPEPATHPPVMPEQMAAIFDQNRALFMSYAHADNESDDPKERWLDRFLQLLKPLVRQQDLTVWSDKDIKIGDKWHERIQSQLENAKAVVVLVSPAFLASDYIANNELPVLLKNAADKGVAILPIIISPCLYEETKFKYPDPKKGPNEFTLASIHSANPPSRTLVEMDEGEQNRVLLKVAKQLVGLLGQNPR